MMTPEHWLKIQEIFAEALEREPAERAKYLTKVCTDRSLRQEVELMIEAHEQGDSGFLEPAGGSKDVLKNGTRIGFYSILALIGSGGMGQVYRALDTKLGREVAIKILPAAFARDPERLARFHHEAKFLASLNHANIASIYGLEDSGNTRALVMELVEGATLADRIKTGPILIDVALPIARQMCEALEYAHERGVVHRDFKPANVKFSRDDSIKVLDFGLAKAVQGEAFTTDTGDSPTLSEMATRAGVLLGTAAYMSPEQAKAKPVDRRADIWAFGCVLYEMLSGKRSFQADSVTETLAAVLQKEPDWSQLPSTTPVHVRVLLHRCLQKDPKKRLRDIGDARISLDEVLTGVPEIAGASQISVSPWLRATPWAISGVFLLLATLLAFLYFHQKPSPSETVRYQIPASEGISPTGGAMSPDGAAMAISGSGMDGQSRVWVQSLEALDVHALSGTEGAVGFPFWSPDSRFIAFFAQGKLKKIGVRGGPVVTLCDAPDINALEWMGDWSRDDQILFATAHGFMQVAASGGSPSPVITGGPGVAPSFLPDGRHFLYTRETGEGVGAYIGLLGAKPDAGAPKKLPGNILLPRYVTSSDPALGYIVFVRGVLGKAAASLIAQRFDPGRLEPVGEPITLAEQIAYHLPASAADVLGYIADPNAGLGSILPGAIQGQLAWFDRKGEILGRFGDPGSYRTLAISPDGKRIAFDRADPQNLNTRNIWLYEFARSVTTRLTFDSSMDFDPVWFPDSGHIVFDSMRGAEYGLYRSSANLMGNEETLVKSDGPAIPGGLSPDGRFLLYCNSTSSSRRWLLPLGGGMDRKPVLVHRSDFRESSPRISPDGRWIAYSSDESGRNEIFVRPFDTSSAMGTPAVSGTHAAGESMVSKDGGVSPLWRRDGKELFYLSSIGGTAMAVETRTSEVFQAGIPRPLFKVPPGVLFWDVSPDGKRFLMASPSGANVAPRLFVTIIRNWEAALKR
jgi:serine/threonine protein kinase